MPIWEQYTIEFFFSCGLFINALLFIPQIIRLWSRKDSKEVSLLTFGGFNIIQLTALLHGVIHSDYILTIGYALSILTCGAVTFLIIYYRIKNRAYEKIS